MTTKRMRSSNRVEIEKAFTQQAGHFESVKTEKSKGCRGGVIQPQYPRKADCFPVWRQLKTAPLFPPEALSSVVKFKQRTVFAYTQWNP